MINKDEEVANRFSDPSKKLVEYVTDFSGNFQLLNETGIIRTDEEIKELYNCKGEFGSTDEVTDMSF